MTDFPYEDARIDKIVEVLQDKKALYIKLMDASPERKRVT